MAEEHHIKWTKYHNLKLWLNNWKETLVELGFTEEDEHGKVQVRNEKEGGILNLDETRISFNRSQGNWVDVSMRRSETLNSTHHILL